MVVGSKFDIRGELWESGEVRLGPGVNGFSGRDQYRGFLDLDGFLSGAIQEATHPVVSHQVLVAEQEHASYGSENEGELE